MRRNDYPTEVLDVKIDHLDYKGRGVAHYIHPPDKGSNGKHLTIMVTNVVPGDVVRVSIDNAKGRKKAVVEYDELLEASPDRNLDIPVRATISGGTPLLYMHYQAQLDYKTELIHRNLADNGFDTSVVQPIIGMDEPSRYRNKMELTFGKNGAIGMHQQGNYRQIIDLEDSILAPHEMVAVKNVVSQWQKEYQLTSYESEKRVGLLRNLVLRQSNATQEMMVVVVATEGPEQFSEATNSLTQQLCESFPMIKSIMWSVNTGDVRPKQTDQTYNLFGRYFIYDELSGFRYRIWENTFFQPNPIQAEKMVDLALDMAGDTSDLRVLDLYCGIGTFSLPFAQQSKSLAGIEIVESSIESARRNASDNGLDNTYFIARDARKGLVELQETWGQPDLLLLDPPRSGAGGKMMRAIGRLGTDKIVYVSCSPKALAEDLVWLRDFGYELVTVQPVDQFPHTNHVECVVLLEKVN